MDLQQRVIRREAGETKTSEPRVVFLCDHAYDILTMFGRVRSLEHNRVSLMFSRGNPVEIDAAKRAYRRREELLSREEARGVFQMEKCSPGAFDKRK